MKNRKFYIIITLISLIIISTTILSGCKLAIETADDITNDNMLCGVFIIMGETMNQFYENRNKDLNPINNDTKYSTIEDVIKSSLQASKIEGVLAADGSTVEFDLEGYFIGFSKRITDDGAPCTSFIGGEGLSDLSFKSDSKNDSEDTYTCDATLYVTPSFHDVVHLSPVYKDESGTYYTLLDQATGNSFSGATTGSIFTQSIDNTTTNNSGTKITSEKRVFTLHVTVVDPVDQVIIKEMNEKDELIKSTEYFQDSPEDFFVDPNTKYVLVEETLSNKSRDKEVKRSVYNPLPKDSNESNNIHSIKFLGSNGRIEQKTVIFRY